MTGTSLPLPSLNETDAALLRAEWQALQAALPAPARADLSCLVASQAGALVTRFYQVLEQDQDAREYLSKDLVRNRLSGALARWLTSLFPGDAPPDFDSMAALQLHVGAVHARIGLPLKLVSRGLRLMMEGLIHTILSEADPQYRRVSLTASCATLSIAIDIMNTAWVEQNRRNRQSAEAFRLFALGKNLTQERETQRAAMAEWMQQTMFTVAAREGLEDLPDLHGSEFGLWLAHRGAVLFEGTPEMRRAQSMVERIDRVLLPQIRRAENLREALASLSADAAEIRGLVLQCFNAAARIEGGHDALTGVLSRRFMDAILTREVETARRRHASFSVALIDLDFFKSINDRFGHAAGDHVLRQAAEVILDVVRAGDFVFRYGGEEFLVTLAEMDLPGAIEFGERVLEAMHAKGARLHDGTPLAITASIGVAEFAGEPDFQRLTQAADEALYKAKNEGRNRVCAARPAQGTRV